MTTTESPAAWLAALAPGDEVVVDFDIIHDLATVARVTESRVIVRWGACEKTYSRHDGRLLWRGRESSDCIRELTPERKDAYHRRALLKRIWEAAWHEMPTATLERIAALVEVPRG